MGSGSDEAYAWIALHNDLAAADDWPSNPQWTGESYFQNGNFALVDHGNGLFSAFHHLDSIQIDQAFWSRNGPPVKRGQIISHRATTGTKTPHLHYQVWHGEGFLHGKVDAIDHFRNLF